MFKDDPWYQEMASSDFNILKGPNKNTVKYEYGRRYYFVYPEEYIMLLRIEALRKSFDTSVIGIDYDILNGLREALRPDSLPS